MAGLIVSLLSPASWAASPAAVPSAPATRLAASPSSAASPSHGRSAAPPAPTPVPISEQQNVISFLGSAIGWYRQLSTESGLIEEPSEALYLAADQALADDIIKLAFAYADAEAAFLTKFGQPGKQPAAAPAASAASVAGSHLADARAQVSDIQTRVKDISARLKAVPRKQQDPLKRQLVAAQAELELANSRVDFLTTMVQFESGNTQLSPASGLQAQIDELRRSLQLEAKPNAQSSANNQSEPAGIIGLGEHLLELRTKYTTLDQRESATDAFARSVVAAHAPLEQQMVSIDKQAGQLAQLAVGDDRTTIEQRKKDFEQLIAQRKLLGAALLPLTKQQVLLRRYTDNLGQWRGQVMRHSRNVLQALLLHLAGLLVLFALIFALAMVWRSLAVRYVEDVNRRRQILKVRDVTVVILVIILLLFNFTTELGALATVVGFAAAGIAVALQDVILSIAGYFRLSGRFGIKHGDRVELQGVRGEVVEIGLTKLTLLELGGDGIQSGPTGRLVMIPNSMAFRDKFVNHPGHSTIIWREIRFTLAPECDFRIVEKQLLEVVEAVFARYRDNARSQLQDMERRLNIRVDSGRPQSRVRLTQAGLEITLRFPVDVRSEAQVADEISRRLLDYIARAPGLRFVPSGTPNIQVVAVTAESGPADHPDAGVDPQQAAPRNQS
jgi:small-conductance mechanosensitive channel